LTVDQSTPLTSPAPDGRIVTLVMCSTSGQLLGTLPPVPVGSPWWPDVGPVVDAAAARGVAVRVLRLLEADGQAPRDGHVAYLAELLSPPTGRLLPVPDHLAALATREDPRRARWARPGGVADVLSWADGVLHGAGTPRTGPAVQVKSWNLSSVLRLPTARGPVWCKSVPPFLAHEGAAIAAVATTHRELVPVLLGSRREPGGSGTVLLDDVPGEDRWEAPLPVLVRMVRAWVDVQAAWAGRAQELLAAGLPDRRTPALLDAVLAVIGREDVRAELAPDEVTALDRLAAGLPGVLRELDACGLPPTLVHGDLHPGNWRGPGDELVLLDWGDSGVGHPLLDLPAFLTRVPDEGRRSVLAAWADAWRERAPDADPDRAVHLVAPVAELVRAVVYRTFLDGIEASERTYHDGDVAAALRAALQAARRQP